MEEVVEFAAQRMGFSDQKTLASSNDLPGMENRVPYCGHECAHHAALMSPAIWSGLPDELLQRVFARLPLAGIIRLQCLSKQWNRNLNSDDLKQVCADAHPKLFAIISQPFNGSFKVRLYDLRSNTLHVMEIDTGYPLPFHMNASDGGLVCFACTSAKKGSIEVPVLVCNPLTRAVRALPFHSHKKSPPQMLQLVMDRISKCYQVLIVSTDRNGGLVAEIFHSNTGAWTTTNLSDLKYFSGHRYGCESYDHVDYEVNDDTPCVYDCAAGHFLDILQVLGDELRDDSEFNSLKPHALVQDRLFVFCQKDREAIEGGGFSEPECYIAEYQGVESGENWLKLKDHRCCNSGYLASGNYYLTLHACKGFLLVHAHHLAFPCQREFERLYDLSTGKWHARSPGFLKIGFDDMMCELQWDAVP